MKRYSSLLMHLTVVTVVVLAGCSGTGSESTSRVTTTRASASVPATVPPSRGQALAASVSCGQVEDLIKNLVQAQNKLDSAQQSLQGDINYDVVLSMGIAVIQAAKSGNSTQLDSDLGQFKADASQYVNGDNSVTSAIIASDISALASDCGVPAAS